MEAVNIKKFIRENREIVLLIYDFYETRHIPMKMTDLKKNLSLFPVANVPLLEYILSSLCDQQFFNVILAGSGCKEVISHAIKIDVSGRMNIATLDCEGKSLGDLMRYIDDNGLDFDDLLVIYANHYTNYPLKNILERHRKGKDVIMTLFLHPSESNSNVSHLYGLDWNEVVFYSKCVNEVYDEKKVVEAVLENGTIEFTAGLSSPTIAVVSSKIFPLFTENFDFGTLGDLVKGVLAFNAYNFKVMCCIQGQADGIEEGISGMDIERKSGFYSKEIVTLYDYFKFNEDVREGKAVDLRKFRWRGTDRFQSFVQIQSNFFDDEPNEPDAELYEPISNTVVGCDLKFVMNRFIRDSVVGHGCFIGGNVDRCIVWDDVCVEDDFMDHIMFSEGQMFHCSHLEEDEEEEEYCNKERTSFFDDVLVYMMDVAQRDYVEEIDIEDVVKQITLLRIMWNASEVDLIEAFSIFLVEIVEEEDVDGSTIKGSMFFPVIEEHMYEIERQEMLMSLVLQGLSEYSKIVRRNVVNRYGYLLFDDGIISCSVMKKYNALVK
ncbi:subunit of translation initiation factor 2B [Ordospora colligata OC4]|uniref:Subunit of translation initiation factor 2B n=1 Tax=Ordospora colligata OC4 TaxID=1354746 RepID=A0A0B2UKZ2_9MICR|nr:subunit of translation initiation factor 2B [Ordospora colligata OC4]KHN69655.1 subunit of translation initiation factor 2B [Ordospora colligata OC4]